ncbi:TPA: hypothetical protein ACGRRP_001037 [Enterobacter hormaechei]
MRLRKSIGVTRTRVRRLDAMADWRVARRESAAAWKPWLLAWC